MKNFLNKYNATKIETTKDEGKLSLDSCKKRILSILDENMRNFKKDTWNVGNRMNKLIVDTEISSIFTLRLGGKRIVRYSLSLLDTREKLNFLSDFHASIVNGEFDEEILNFLENEISKADARKKINGEKRREKKRKEREQKQADKKEAERRTYEAAKGLIDDEVYNTLVASNTTSGDMPRYMQL